MSTCFRCEIQTVYSCFNRTEITENQHQKLKPNRTENNLNRGSPNAYLHMIKQPLHIISQALTEIYPP